MYAMLTAQMLNMVIVATQAIVKKSWSAMTANGFCIAAVWLKGLKMWYDESITNDKFYLDAHAHSIDEFLVHIFKTEKEKQQ